MNTLSQIFFENSLLYKDKKLFGFKKGGEWHHVSWNKASDLVQNLSVGLREIGIKKNDKISIIAENSYKWCVTDLAIISLGAIIQGDTPHFDFISQASTNAIMDLSVNNKKPIGNGIITCLNMKQAKARKQKGAEAAKAVISILAQK
mgnify:CR=1 FL=1